jgi:mannosyl-3-phosphoglycerate phosphatase
MTTVVFTDLDGSLLDRDTYAWDAASLALEHIRRNAVPWIVVTSKTRAEVQHYRKLLGNNHPFVVENGGAIFIPHGYFPFPVPGAALREGYELVEWGKPYGELTAALQAASRYTRCRVAGFHEMTAEKVARICRLPIDLAVLAKQREYDEPFYVIDKERERQLKAAIAAQGLRSAHGGRFYHIGGGGSKASAVKLLSALFREARGHVVTVGLGDSQNDASLLQAVDLPVIIRSRYAGALQSLVPYAKLTWHEGPVGWNDAVLEILRNHDEFACSG